jgi:surface carbohydrate biosynthesis protein (TIGR04326 family)
MKYNQKKVIIWDSSNSIPDKECLIILWNSHSDKKHKNVISILDLIDLESVLFRKQYLNFIWEIGETKIDNERVIDKLKFRKNFSYWWLTLITEKSIYKSPHINDIIKLFALEKFINESEIDGFNYENSKITSLIKVRDTEIGFAENYDFENKTASTWYTWESHTYKKIILESKLFSKDISSLQYLHLLLYPNSCDLPILSPL